ncbi:uncharacterized protein LOC133867700 [Alnus glutinosa]|uniref:uncharacterized protein LOC133867700 n=1 Tax=Alnus glutinosa TaxID=3517 RepID=UPI002D78AE44|nr:uncharacterized protein LOC133867700 [Alnus glutinosa]
MCLTIVRKLLRTWMNTIKRLVENATLTLRKGMKLTLNVGFKIVYMGAMWGMFSKQLYDLACEADHLVRSNRDCIVNGVRFHTKKCEQTRITQNSGIVVRGEHGTSNIEFYGVLRNILELRYPGPNHVYLFECDWWNTGSRTGMQMDQYFTTVNTSRTWLLLP